MDGNGLRQDYEASLLQAFRGLNDNLSVGMIKNNGNVHDIQPFERPPEGIRLKITAYLDDGKSQHDEIMEYYDCEVIQTKRGLCGSSKIKYRILSMNYSEGVDALQIDDKSFDPPPVFSATLLTSKDKRIIVQSITSKDLGVIRDDLMRQQVKGMIENGRFRSEIRWTVSCWKAQYHACVYQSMLKFIDVYEQVEVDIEKEKKMQDWQPLVRVDSAEEYSDIAVKINEDKDEVMDPGIRSLNDSISNYQTMQITKTAMTPINIPKTLDKDKYHIKAAEERKTNFDHLAQYSDKKLLKRIYEDTPKPFESNASNFSNDQRFSALIKSAVKQKKIYNVCGVIVQNYKFDKIELRLQRLDSSNDAYGRQAYDRLCFEHSVDKFSEQPLIDAFKPMSIMNLSDYFADQCTQYSLAVEGVTCDNDRLIIGRLIVTLDDITEMFDSFNHNYLPLPMIKLPSISGVDCILLLTIKQLSDVERFSIQESEGLFNEMLKSPQYEIFSRNSMTQHNYWSNDKTPAELPGNLKVAALMRQQSSAILTIVDIGEIVANEKLRSAVCDIFEYKSESDIVRLANKTEKYYRHSMVAVRESFRESQLLKQSTLISKSILFDPAKSYILNDIRIVMQDAMKIEAFELQLSDNFLSKWMIIERLEGFHQRVWRLLQARQHNTGHRFKESERSKRRVHIMNHLFYNILEAYYCKPFIWSKSNGMETQRITSAESHVASNAFKKFNPLMRATLRGVSFDYYLLSVFLIDRCPILTNRIVTDWHAAVLSVIPCMLELLSGLLSSHKFAILLDSMFDGHMQCIDQSMTMVGVICTMLDLIERKATEGCWSLDLAGGMTFMDNLKLFITVYEYEIFQEYRRQTKENFIKVKESSKNIISSIYFSIHEAVTEGNTLGWIDRTSVELQQDQTLSDAISTNTACNSLALKLADICQTTNLNTEGMLSMINSRQAAYQSRLFIKVSSFSRSHAGKSRHQARSTIDIGHRQADSSVSHRVVMKAGRHGSGASVVIDLASEWSCCVRELGIDLDGRCELLMEVQESDVFDIYRYAGLKVIGSTAVSLKNLRRDIVQTIDIIIRHNDDYYDECHITLQVLISMSQIVEVMRDDSIVDSSRKNDDYRIEKEVIFEDKRCFETMSRCQIIAGSMAEAYFVQVGQFKMNISTFEVLISRCVFNAYQRVFPLHSASASRFNYFENSSYYADRVVSYREIVENLMQLSDVEFVKYDSTLKRLPPVSSLSLFVRILAFNHDLDLMVDCLTAYFGSQSGGMNARDLVCVFVKLMAVVHVRSHSLEMCTMLASSLDGLDLRPRLASCRVVLARNKNVMRTALQNKDGNDGGGSTGVSQNESILLDLTRPINEIIYWLSFKYDNPKLMLGDETRLFVIEELVLNMTGKRSISTQFNFVSIRLEHNQYSNYKVIEFDQHFRPEHNDRNTATRPSAYENITKPTAALLFDIERYAIDLRPLTSKTIARIDVCRLLHSSAVLRYIRDLTRF